MNGSLNFARASTALHAPQPLQRLRARVHAAAVGALLTLAATTSMAQAPIAGSLDTSFAPGTGEITNISIGTSTDNAFASTVPSDAKNLLKGTCTVGALIQNFCVARLNHDGTMNSSFIGPSGSATGKFLLDVNAGGFASANAIALQPDGKIVLTGVCGYTVRNRGA